MKDLSYSFIVLTNKNFALLLDEDEVSNHFQKIISAEFTDNKSNNKISKNSLTINTLYAKYQLDDIEEHMVENLKNIENPSYGEILALVLGKEGVVSYQTLFKYQVS